MLNYLIQICLKSRYKWIIVGCARLHKETDAKVNSYLSWPNDTNDLLLL